MHMGINDILLTVSLIWYIANLSASFICMRGTLSIYTIVQIFGVKIEINSFILQKLH